MELNELARSIETRGELVEFILALREDFRTNPDEWENPTLDRYLEAFAGWLTDLDGLAANQGRPVPTQPDWGLDALFAASMYE